MLEDRHDISRRQSWYLLGPVTRFQTVGDKVEYEVAQQPILAFRASGDATFPSADEIQVVCAKTVSACDDDMGYMT